MHRNPRARQEVIVASFRLAVACGELDGAAPAAPWEALPNRLTSASIHSSSLPRCRRMAVRAADGRQRGHPPIQIHFGLRTSPFMYHDFDYR